MTTYTFGSEAEGLQFKIDVTQDGANASFTVTLLYGSMNINALYWSDGDATAGEGSLFTLTKSTNALNMNGATFEGETVAWDGSTFLSNAGLGSTPPSTYLTSVGATYSGSISNVTVEQLAYLGVRATSTSSEGGSIKWISDPDPVAPPPDNHFPEWGSPDISHITLYWRDDSFLIDDAPNANKGGPDGWFTVKFNYDFDDPDFPLTNDLDNDLDDLLDFLVTKGDITEGHKDLLVGVAIKGGQSGEVWYDLDNDPNDTDTPPADVLGYPIENNEVDQAYQWNDATNMFAVPV